MNIKKKVVFLHIGSYLSPVPRIHIMAEKLVKENYDVTVICGDGNSELYLTELNGVKIINVNLRIERKLNRYKKLLEITRLMKEELLKIQPQPDLIQIFSPLLIPIGTYLKLKLKCKLIYDCYEYWTGSALSEKKYHSALIYFLNDLLGATTLDGVIYVYEKNPTRSFFKIIGNKLIRRNVLDCIIYNIPENKIIKKEIPDRHLKSEMFSNEECFIIGYLGLIMPFKGYEFAIKCMTYLDERYRLLLIGDSIDLKFKEKICNIIKENNLESRVRFTGVVPHFDALMYTQICDVGLILFEDTPWTKYSTPNKLFEYMSLGIPIIANDIPNLRYFIDKYSCGLTVQKNDPILIAKSVENIKRDLNLKKQFSNNGKNAYFKYFTEDIQMGKLIDLYSKVL